MDKAFDEVQFRRLILAAYGRMLEQGGPLLRPVTTLPFPKALIRASLLHELAGCHDTKLRNALEVCLMGLADFRELGSTAIAGVEATERAFEIAKSGDPEAIEHVVHLIGSPASRAVQTELSEAVAEGAKLLDELRGRTSTPNTERDPLRLLEHGFFTHVVGALFGACIAGVLLWVIIEDYLKRRGGGVWSWVVGLVIVALPAMGMLAAACWAGQTVLDTIKVRRALRSAGIRVPLLKLLLDRRFQDNGTEVIYRWMEAELAAQLGADKGR